MTTSNPFEPPRTTDLDGALGGGDGAKGALALSEESLRELVAATPWVRWLSRVTALSIAVGVVGAVADLTGPANAAGKMGSMVNVVISTALATMVLVVLRRYAAASERLRAGTRSAAGDVIDGQAAYFKLIGVFIIVALCLTVGLLLLVTILSPGIFR